MNHFSVRCVIAVFGGAAAGLLVGVIGKYVFGADWNVSMGMSWGIMAAALGLAFSRTMRVQEDAETQARKSRDLQAGA